MRTPLLGSTSRRPLGAAYAALVRDRMRESGLRQREIALAAGLTEGGLSHIMRGRREPAAETRDKLDPVSAPGSRPPQGPEALCYLLVRLETNGTVGGFMAHDDHRPAAFFRRDLADSTAQLLMGLTQLPIAPVPAWPDFVALLASRAAEARSETVDDPAAEIAAMLLDSQATDDPGSVAQRIAAFVVAFVRSHTVAVQVPTPTKTTKSTKT